ncbi:MAG TPA: TIGR03067 domain-containing protein [Urbifossiella sp.]|nr:TIGR03067 domain-containing protein [Urbifossiella sp.]
MRAVPLLIAAALAVGVVGFSPVSGQPPAAEKKADPDLARLQGEWVVTKVELPPSEKGPDDDILKSTRIRIKDDMVTGVLLAPDGTAVEFWYGRLTLDTSKTPRHLDLLPVGKNGEPYKQGTAKAGKDGQKGTFVQNPVPPFRAIYKLEAGTLVVCLPEDNGRDDGKPRPTAFQAAKSTGANPAFGVGYLTKKK